MRVNNEQGGDNDRVIRARTERKNTKREKQ